jgi:hypothetical protein
MIIKLHVDAAPFIHKLAILGALWITVDRSYKQANSSTCGVVQSRK